jgi:drug/metabolite transporter (DMT)-like permease
MQRSPISAGVLFALAAAVAFGSSTPFVRRFGSGVGPLTTACLLYSGAALVTLLVRGRPGAEARVRPSHLPRIFLVAIAGAVVAPAALAWGLQHADATGASLLLNCEALFTALLAQLVFRESIGARVWVAILLMVAGGGLIVISGAHVASIAALGFAAVLVATFAWALDNTFTRPLSDLDPIGIVARKATLGALFAGALAMALREPLPPHGNAGVLLACGATGYGLSLRFYLLAQRRMGAARTGSVFSVGPFVGAVLAWAIGEGHGGPAMLGAGAFFAVAVYLHLSETHSHEHLHEPFEHEHAHRHDDGHHDHAHDPPVIGAHSHSHAHSSVRHAHEHAPDVHHGHRH